ncbi:MAG: RNase J family beta-CASP ribonuclease [Eubacteriales bacterium]|nr:RNase J family beta-CASP ribonuclease [Eubacteriales bacterium]
MDNITVKEKKNNENKKKKRFQNSSAKSQKRDKELSNTQKETGNEKISNGGYFGKKKKTDKQKTPKAASAQENASRADAKRTSGAQPKPASAQENASRADAKRTSGAQPKAASAQENASRADAKRTNGAQPKTASAQENTSRADAKRTSGAQPKAGAPVKENATAIPPKAEKNRDKRKKNEKNGKVRVISLGGLGEIGKNITVFETDNDIVVIDCGLAFPDDDMLGIDLVIPDFSYLEKNREKVRAVLITHGHEDHIGGIPYLLKTVNAPVYGSRLAIGIIEKKLAETTLPERPRLCPIEAGDTVKLGDFMAEFIHVNHSIADSCAILLRTPAGNIFHSGDFKLDVSPIDGKMMDITRIGEIGNEGVTLMLCESTNAERPGFTPSEKKVGNSLEQVFMQNTDKRLVIATFSSNVHRVQQIIDVSVKHNRKVAVLGRSMENIVSAAVELGYMRVPEGTIINIGEIKRFNPEQLTIVTTGSQGEPMSGLYRMAFGEHDKVQLSARDVVILSSSAIPGNEKLVGKIVNALVKSGIKVVNDSTADFIHVSGHACCEELKLMHALVRPKFFMPIHGESRHLYAHKEIAEFMGMNPANVFVSDIGRVLEVDRYGANFVGTVPSGRTFVDGSGVGDVGNIVLRDRKHLSQDGLIVVVATLDMEGGTILSGPDIVSRGFIYVREAEDLIESARKITVNAIERCFSHGTYDWMQIKSDVRDDLSRFLFNKTKRRPMILPIIMNI